MEELFRSDLDVSSTGLNSGGDIGSSSSEPGGSGDWTNPQQSGLDGDLQRSQEAVALNELLQEQGLEGGAVDALVQGDSYGALGGASDDPLLSEVAPPPLALSLVVLDQSLQNWRELAVSAPADAELLVLDQAADGVAQISDYLLQQRLDIAPFVIGGQNDRNPWLHKGWHKKAGRDGLPARGRNEGVT